MNRTVNQLVNALHLDPKREAAVRKIIENAGGVNDSTPIINEVSGNELVPINQNGENKAVSAAALVKGAKEVYVVDLDNYNETIYNEIKAAYTANKIIIINDKIATFTDSDSAYISDLENKKTIYYTFYITQYSSSEYSISTFKSFAIELTADSLIPSDDGTYTFKSAKTVDSSYNMADVYSVYVNSYYGSNNVIPTNNHIIFYKQWYYNYQTNYGPVYIGMVYPESGSINSENFDIWTGRIYRNTDGYMYLSIKKISEFITNGDGTKFLSDDGTYKEVSGGEPYIWDGTHEESTKIELEQAILANRTIIFNAISCTGVLENGFILIKTNLPFNNLLFVIFDENMAQISADYMFIKNSSTVINPAIYNYFNVTYDITFILVSGDNLVEDLPNTHEFNGEFSFGDTVYTVTFPEEVKWSTDSVLEYKANHTYQFRILNNLGVMKEFANA